MNLNLKEKYLNHFKNFVKTNDLLNYYQIPKKKDNDFFKLKINDISNSEINLTITFTRIYKSFYFYDLPYEINEMIKKYMIDTITLNTSLNFLDSFPFIPPAWTIINFNTNLKKKKNLLAYFNYKIEKFNIDLYQSWCLVYIHKIILQFIIDVCNFDNIISNKYYIMDP